MGAFIERSSKGERTGIWVSNGERYEFLDWFAEHRCQLHDATWSFCMCPGNRWSGCGLDLDKLLLSDQQPLEFTEAELRDLSPDYQARFARMLQVLAQIWTGEWKHQLGSEEALSWDEVN